MSFATKLVSGLLACALSPSVAIGAQPGGIRVVKTVDLYTYSEDITYVRSGPHAKHVAFIEDAKVLAYPLSSKGKGSATELFDLTGRIPRGFMNGLAYMDSEKRFAIVSREFMDKLMVFEPNGRLESERLIQYPPGYTVNWVEGFDYIPPDSDNYPDHLVMCAGEGDGETTPQTGDILILRRDGSLAKHIDLPASFSACGAIAYRAPDKLLVTGNNGDWGIITILDFDGNVLGVGPERIDPAGEGLVSLPDGNVLAVGVGGDVLMLDANLMRKPDGDRTFRPTQGSLGHISYGLAWNSDKGTFVLCANSPVDSIHYSLYDLPLAFNGAVKLTDLSPRPVPPYYRQGRLTYLPNEDLIGLAQRYSDLDGDGIPVLLSVQLFRGNDGSHHSEVILPDEVRNRGIIRGLAHLSSTNQFAVTFNGVTDENGNWVVDERGKVHIVSRFGAFVRTIDYSATITRSISAVAAFPSGTELLLTDGYILYVGDLTGNVTAQYPLSDYGMIGARGSVLDLALVTSGEYDGMFAAVDNNRAPYKLTIFTFDQPGKKKSNQWTTQVRTGGGPLAVLTHHPQPRGAGQRPVYWKCRKEGA